MMKRASPVLLSVLLATISLSGHSESLLEVYRQAQQNNPELRAAAAKCGEASAKIAQVRGALLPQLGLNGNYTRIHRESHTPQRMQAGSTAVAKSPDLPLGPFRVNFPDRQVGGHSKDYANNTNLDLILTQSILNFSHWSQLSSAKKTAVTQDLEYQAAQQKLMLETATRYVQVLVALEKFNCVTTEKLALARKLQETQQQHQVGIAPPTALYQAQAKYDAVLAGEVHSSNELGNTLEQLRQISGHYYRQLNRLESRAFKPQPLHGTVEAWLNNSQQQNLLLLTARVRQSIALESVRGLKMQHLPTLQLEAKVSHRRQQAEELTRSRELSGGIQLHVPLFSGGQIVAGVKRAQFELLHANEQLESTHRAVSKETREAYNTVSTAISASRAYQQAVNSAQRWLDACEACYQAGTETLASVLQARLDLFAAKLQLAQVRYDYFIGQLKLKAAAGQLTEQDLQTLDQVLRVVTSTTPSSTLPPTQ